MIVKEDQILDRADNKLSSASITTGTIQSSRNFSPPVHHKHRHKHNIVNNRNTSSLTSSQSLSTSDLSTIGKKLFENNQKTPREFLLYNRCSGKFLNFIDKSINASSEEDNPYCKLNFTFNTLFIEMCFKLKYLATFSNDSHKEG
jgi:hypothetical protein